MDQIEVTQYVDGLVKSFLDAAEPFTLELGISEPRCSSPSRIVGAYGTEVHESNAQEGFLMRGRWVLLLRYFPWTDYGTPE